MNKTFIPSSLQRHLYREWFLIDASEKTLGRLATEVANLLQGKNKVNFNPSVDMSNYVIITNVKKIRLTGNKELQKLYYRHSGRPGGLKKETLQSLRNRIPQRIFEKAVKGMLPKGPLGRKMFARLKVFEGAEHSYLAQSPQQLSL